MWELSYLIVVLVCFVENLPTRETTPLILYLNTSTIQSFPCLVNVIVLICCFTQVWPVRVLTPRGNVCRRTHWPFFTVPRVQFRNGLDHENKLPMIFFVPTIGEHSHELCEPSILKLLCAWPSTTRGLCDVISTCGWPVTISTSGNSELSCENRSVALQWASIFHHHKLLFPVVKESQSAKLLSLRNKERNRTRHPGWTHVRWPAVRTTRCSPGNDCSVCAVADRPLLLCCCCLESIRPTTLLR